jgi:cytochrome c peroxidase
MSLTNVAYAAKLGWADPFAVRLEAQALVPLLAEHPLEMGLSGREDDVLARFANDPAVRAAFGHAFPDEDEPVTLDNVTRAIAAFERTLISGESAWDRWAFGADPTALAPDEREGARLFFSSRARCSTCHGGFNLAGSTVWAGSADTAPDGPRSPTLRNIALTAPYMRDGSLPTLEAVIDFYAAGGRAIAGVEDSGFDLSPDERRALVAFLGALTDRAFVERAVAGARAPGLVTSASSAEPP